MPQPPRDGDQPPAPAVVGALGGYPPLGPLHDTEPAPKKRSVWRWLAPSIAGIILLIGAGIVVAVVTAPQNEPVARQACVDAVIDRGSPGPGGKIGAVLVAKGWEKSQSKAVAAALERWSNPVFSKDVYVVLGTIDTEADAHELFLCDVTVVGAKVTREADLAVIPR